MSEEHNARFQSANSEKAWMVLDNIDSASDAFRPSTVVHYEKMWAYILKLIKSGLEIKACDGETFDLKCILSTVRAVHKVSKPETVSDYEQLWDDVKKEFNLRFKIVDPDKEDA